jgi:hypothetical protein
MQVVLVSLIVLSILFSNGNSLFIPSFGRIDNSRFHARINNYKNIFKLHLPSFKLPHLNLQKGDTVIGEVEDIVGSLKEPVVLFSVSNFQVVFL